MANANKDDDSVALLSDDPFKILGLDEPTADKKVLKRAYKKRALKFHPDVITDLHSTPEDKKKASDRFAKINWAYETLMGKNKDGSSSGVGRSSSSSTSSSSSGWTPPHRRKGGTSSSSSSSSDSKDWRDFMPNYGNYKETYNEEYDTGGDSFGKIFSDLFTSAAMGAAGVASGTSGGIFAEFIDFLEGDVGGGTNNYGSNSNNDAALKSLLKTGSLESIAEEMDDTELVVRQLELKATALDDELLTTDAEAKMASKFSEQIKLEERADELKARKNVVVGYLKRARTRLLSLQTRYKELITYEGANDSHVRSSGQRGAYDNRRRASDPSSYSSPSSGRKSGSTSSTGESDGSSNNDDTDDSWKNEGFGSSSRSRSRRGSARKRGTRRTPTTAESVPGQNSNFSTGYSSSSPPPSSPPPSSNPSRTDAPYSSSSSNSSRRQPQRSSSTSSSTSSSSLNKYGEIPPHRRTRSYTSQQEEDKERMREIKVDEEFDKLKKELGL